VTNVDTGERVLSPDEKVSSATYKIGKRRFIKIKTI